MKKRVSKKINFLLSQIVAQSNERIASVINNKKHEEFLIQTHDCFRSKMIDSLFDKIQVFGNFHINVKNVNRICYCFLSFREIPLVLIHL